MAKFTTGTDFTGGGSFSGTQMNNAINNAAILPGLITELTDIVTVDVADQVMISDTSAAGALKRATVTELFAGQPVDGAVGVGTARTLGTGAQQAAPGNSVKLGTTLTAGKLRLTAGGGTPSEDVAAGAKDLVFSQNTLGNGSAAINWDLSDLFWGTPTGAVNPTFTFSNLRAGRIITVALYLGVNGVAWSGTTFTWSGGTLVGAATPADGTKTWNVFTFVCYSGTAYFMAMKSI